MSVFVRGAKNAVRNPVRAGSVVLLLGVATAFALSLLLANQAVKNKIETLKANQGTTLSISPAGSAQGPGAQGGGEPLTTEMLTKVKALANVADTGATLGGGGFRVMRAEPSGSGPSTDTGGTATFTPPESEIDLVSPIEAGTLGRRNFNSSSETSTEDTPSFQIPVQATGVSDNLDESGKNYVLTDGEWFTSDSGYNAVVGTDLATKNSLKVGSTFTAYDQTFTVIGIYDAGNTFANASVLMPLSTFQTLSDRAGEVSSIVVKVNSIDNVESVKSAIESALGDTVDVTSSAQNTEDAISSLKSIQKISIAGVVIAIAAAGVIVFMVMVMIVRERKKEIAVLKAIGGSNIKITAQFVTEAVILTFVSVVIGSLIALASSNSMTKLLITTNTTDSSSSSDTTTLQGPGGATAARGGGFRRLVGGPGSETQETTKDLLSDVKTNVGAAFIAEGLAAVILIGALGSAIPAFAISKVRPAEVMRGE